jgi:hypothetical protein
MRELVSLAVAALAPAKSVSATDTSAAFDISDFTGNCRFVLNSGAVAATGTSDVKLTHCDTIGGAYTDTGIAFAQVAQAASVQDLLRNVDGLKKYVKVVNTLGGGSPAVPFSLMLIGKKANG